MEEKIMASTQTRTVVIEGQEVTLYNYAFQMVGGFIQTAWARNQIEAARIVRGEQPSYCF